MADGKSTDPKSPQTKSGPVKPPVLEGKARVAAKPVQAPKAESVTPLETIAVPPKSDLPKDNILADAAPKPVDSKPVEPEKAVPPSPPKPPTSPVVERSGGVAPIWPALAGGILGVAAAYGLALGGFWPVTPAAPVADQRVATLSAEVPELRTVAETTQSELATLNQRIGVLEAAPPAVAANGAAPAVDLSGIESDIAALVARVDALPTAAPQVDTTEIAALRNDLSALDNRLTELGARVGTAEASVQTLGNSVAATTATLDAQPTDIGAVLQLPLILSGFEAAFVSGRPYETELSALRAAVPDVAVPTGIANTAGTGLVRADVIASRFAQVLPDILAGRPANPQAGWQDGAAEWFRSMIALRPTEAVEGNDPEAVVSRLEAAIARRDFASAEQLFTGLSAPMLAAAADVPANVALQAEAARFLDVLREQALSGVSGATP